MFATTNYADMIEGLEVDLALHLNRCPVNDILLPILERKGRVTGTPPLQIYLPSGIPFLSGTLEDFFGISTCNAALRILDVVVTRRIADAFLMRVINDVCDASTEDWKLLLAPVVPLSDISYSHIACLLGYLGQSGIKGDPFVMTIATFTEFAPLVCGLWRITENHPLLGPDVVAVTAGLHGFYSSLLPSIIPLGKFFECVLRCSTFFLHGITTADEERISLPIMKVEVNQESADTLHQ
jgi:hypothetical protein